jgi:hypothetical protein
LNEHLKLLNGLIGFASSLEGWPRPLHEQGFLLYWVGPSYMVSGNKRANPDLLFVSKPLNRMATAFSEFVFDVVHEQGITKQEFMAVEGLF